MTIYMQTKTRPAQELPMTEAERKARVELAAAYRIFDMLGWVEMIFNHITVRVPGPDLAGRDSLRFLINPFGLHTTALERPARRDRPQLECRHIAKRTGVLGHRRASATHDEHVLHVPPSRIVNRDS